MSEIEQFIKMFVAIIFSLAIAIYDFSGMQYGNIINLLGMLSTVGIPTGYLLNKL